MKILESLPPGRQLIRSLARKSVLKMTRGHYPAVLKAIDVVVANYGAKRGVALDLEAKEFGRLVSKGGHKNLIRTFYLMERYKKEKWTEAK